MPTIHQKNRSTAQQQKHQFLLAAKNTRRPVFKKFCDPADIAELDDAACAISIFGGGILELRNFADRRGEES
jgi:hypothetical protein